MLRHVNNHELRVKTENLKLPNINKFHISATPIMDGSGLCL